MDAALPRASTMVPAPIGTLPSFHVTAEGIGINAG